MMEERIKHLLCLIVSISGFRIGKALQVIRRDKRKLRNGEKEQHFQSREDCIYLMNCTGFLKMNALSGMDTRDLAFLTKNCLLLCS